MWTLVMWIVTIELTGAEALTREDSAPDARQQNLSPSRCASAVARRSDRHLRACACLGEQRLHVRSLDRLASGTEAFVESVQRPDVARVLDVTRQRVVESEIGAVDRLGLAMTSLVQQ